MNLAQTEEKIALPTFTAYCDICSKGYRFEIPTPVTIRPAERVAAGYVDYSAKPYETIPPLTIEVARGDFTARGWKTETIHGKEIVVCPVCALKP